MSMSKDLIRICEEASEATVIEFEGYRVIDDFSVQISDEDWVPPIFTKLITGFMGGDTIYKCSKAFSKIKGELSARGTVLVSDESSDVYLYKNSIIAIKGNTLYSNDYTALVDLVIFGG